MAAAGAVNLRSGEPWTLPDKGKVGILSLILTESAFFSIFVGAYIFYIGKSLAGPFPKDVLSVPVFSTICLLSSSVTIVIAVRALRTGALRTFAVWWLITLALGLEFMVATTLEWHRLIYEHGLTISTNLFGTTYYSLVGLHAFHVSAGLIMLTVVLIFGLARKVHEDQSHRVDVLALYWHFVDLVWLFVFTCFYLL
jgi:cytochrome c oxidase subunit 3/cytochrome o ubiquinol oxidase subunit 3